MIKIDLSKDTLPFSEKELKNILVDIYEKNNEKISQLKDTEELKMVNMFNKKEINTLDGFKITTTAQLNDNNVSMYIDEILLFEDEDEWISAYRSMS